MHRPGTKGEHKIEQCLNTQQMIVFYPGYCFENLAVGRSETEAREVLAALSAAYHPSVLEKTREIPRWSSAAQPCSLEGAKWVIIPPCCDVSCSADWVAEQESFGVQFVRGLETSSEIVSHILSIQKSTVSQHESSRPATSFDDVFVRNTQSLGLISFFVELLVRQQHFSSVLDETQFHSHIFTALDLYQKDKQEQAHEYLARALETALYPKEYFFPARMTFLDLVLLTPETSGKKLCQLLRNAEESACPVTLFLPSLLLKHFAETEPETVFALKHAISHQIACLILQDTAQQPLHLLPLLEQADRILEGISLFHEILHVSPRIFGRLEGELNPLLPQLLKLCGLDGVILFAPLAGIRYENKNQSRMIWQGVDGTRLDALIRYPNNAESPIGFLNLAAEISNMASTDHAPTAVFARFPRPLSDSSDRPLHWFDALRHSAAISEALGKFVTVDDYFHTDDYGTMRRGQVESPSFAALTSTSQQDFLSQTQNSNFPWTDIYLHAIQRQISSAWEIILTLSGQKISDGLSIAEQFRRFITSNLFPVAEDTKDVTLVLNPWSFSRRVYMELPENVGLPAESRVVALALEKDGKREIIVDVPPMGYAVVEHKTIDKPPQNKKNGFFAQIKRPLLDYFRTKKKNVPSMIQKIAAQTSSESQKPSWRMSNDYFDAIIDGASGMLQSVFSHNTRTNRLSRQVSFRLPNKQRQLDSRPQTDPHYGYAIPLADDVAILSDGPITATLEIKAQLVLPNGTRVCRFVETISIRKRSRQLLFHLQLEPEIELLSDEGGYFCVRYAWSDSEMTLRGCVGDGLHALSGRFLQSPRLVDLRNENTSLTFFTEGLPFHQRTSERRLDTLLLASGDQTWNFRFGIGIDLPHPIPVSLEFIAAKEALQFPVLQTQAARIHLS